MPPPAGAPVSIIGASGALGFGLTVRLAGAGVPVTIGSRERERAEETVERAKGLVPKGAFTAAINADAVKQAELVILCVPFRNQSENLTNLREHLDPGHILVDATSPLAAALGGRATRTVGVWQGSAAQQAQEMAPEGVRVVSALHTVSAALLTDLDHPLDEDVLICGDHADAKRPVAALLERIPGLRCVDCGRLELARITESLTALLISINARHKSHAGIRVTGLPAERWPAA